MRCSPRSSVNTSSVCRVGYINSPVTDLLRPVTNALSVAESAIMTTLNILSASDAKKKGVDVKEIHHAISVLTQKERSTVSFCRSSTKNFASFVFEHARRVHRSHLSLPCSLNLGSIQTLFSKSPCTSMDLVHISRRVYLTTAINMYPRCSRFAHSYLPRLGPVFSSSLESAHQLRVWLSNLQPTVFPICAHGSQSSTCLVIPWLWVCSRKHSPGHFPLQSAMAACP